MSARDEAPESVSHREGWIPVHVSGVGPFVSRIVYRLPGGEHRTWTSRSHRKGHSPKRLTRWIAASFMVGSACFAVASWAGLGPGALGKLGRADVLNPVFFIGSLFFTTAAYLQLVEAANADRRAALERGEMATEPFHWVGWQPRQVGWLSAFTQSVGTIMFNLSTFDALLPNLEWFQQDALLWAPDMFGSVCFLVSAALAVVECCHRLWRLQPRNVAWWVVVLNLLGSIAFMASAILAVVLPGPGGVLNPYLVNLWTFVGAACFFVAAYLTLPEAKGHWSTSRAHRRS